CCRLPGALARLAGSGWRSPAPTPTITVKCRMAARPLSRSIGVSQFSICLACPSKRRPLASVLDKARAMPLEVRSVENLLGTPVPYAYAVKAGPWLFLTGPEAYDWRTGMVDEAVRGPPAY